MATTTIGELLESLVKLEVLSEQTDKVRGTDAFDSIVVRAAAACNRVFGTKDVDQLVLYCRAGGREFNHEWLAEQHAKLIVNGGVDRSKVEAMTPAEFLLQIDDRWEGPMSPAEWRKRFGGMPATTFKRYIEIHKIRIREITTKSILIHRDDVLRYEKTRQ